MRLEQPELKHNQFSRNGQGSYTNGLACDGQERGGRKGERWGGGKHARPSC